LDYPAVVFPVSKVDQGKDVQTRNFQAMTDIDMENWKLCKFENRAILFTELIRADDAHEFDGLPVSLQLVGRRFEDEKVLAVLEYINSKVTLPLEAFHKVAH
jgi:hypothetical protein